VSSVGSSNMKTTGKENYNEWLRAYNSNFFSQTNITENFVKFFKNKKLKKIILISSIAAYFKGGAPLSYSLAKKSLNMYVENISKYLAQFNININTISPGHILQKNNLWEKKINKNKKKTFKMINNTVGLKRFCKPEDLINVINFLASEKSNYITGADFKVDGKTT
jgi:NAD(P)-dependent dehydrogenase (short-subunit alcohol dehydrogenase family)